jgi:hypothetical protein
MPRIESKKRGSGRIACTSDAQKSYKSVITCDAVKQGRSTAQKLVALSYEIRTRSWSARSAGRLASDRLFPKSLTSDATSPVSDDLPPSARPIGPACQRKRAFRKTLIEGIRLRRRVDHIEGHSTLSAPPYAGKLLPPWSYYRLINDTVM